MPECAQINGSGYVSTPIHAKMAKVWIWQPFQYASGTQCSEYTRICF